MPPTGPSFRRRSRTRPPSRADLADICFIRVARSRKRPGHTHVPARKPPMRSPLTTGGALLATAALLLEPGGVRHPECPPPPHRRPPRRSRDPPRSVRSRWRQPPHAASPRRRSGPSPPTTPPTARPCPSSATRSHSGAPLTFFVEENQGDWLRVRLPMRPNGTTGWIRASDVAAEGAPLQPLRLDRRSDRDAAQGRRRSCRPSPPLWAPATPRRPSASSTSPSCSHRRTPATVRTRTGSRPSPRS